MSKSRLSALPGYRAGFLPNPTLAMWQGESGSQDSPRWALEALICAAPVEIRPHIDFERDSPEDAWLCSVTLGLALGHGAIK